MEISKVAGKDVYFFESVESTMDNAKKLCSKIKEPVIVSYIQTHGRGRQGNKWVSNRGGLWCSIVWDGVPKAVKIFLFIIAAKAIVDTLKKFGITAKIKLPNDIFAENRKIAGVLIENIGSHVIIGIGININNTITEEMGDAISCKEILGYRLNIKSILSSLLLNLNCLRKQCEKNNVDFLKDTRGFLI